MVTGGDGFLSHFAQQTDFLPEYLGADGDPRYPSARRLRGFGAALIDYGLFLATMLAAGVAPLVLGAPDWLLISIFLGSALVFIAVNFFLLPLWMRASIGELIFGLARIRTIDGGRPVLGDLGRSALQSNRAPVPHVAVVRRCDVRSGALSAVSE